MKQYMVGPKLYMKILLDVNKELLKKGKKELKFDPFEALKFDGEGGEDDVVVRLDYLSVKDDGKTMVDVSDAIYNLAKKLKGV